MKKGILLVAILMLATCSLDVFAPPRGGRGGGRGGMRGGGMRGARVGGMRGGRGFVGRGMGWRAGGFRGRGWGRGWRHRPGWRRRHWGPGWRRGWGWRSPWYGYGWRRPWVRPVVYTTPTYVETAPAITYWTVRNDSNAIVEFANTTANVFLRPGETKSVVNTGDFSVNGQWYSTDDANISIAPDGTPNTY